MYNERVQESNRSRLPPPETLQPSQEMIGLQGRLLFKDHSYLNPEKDCTKVTKADIGSFADRDYSPFEKASEAERKRYNATYASWSKNLVRSLNNPRNQEHIKKLQDVFHHTGISSDDTFTEENASVLYDRYFRKSNDNPHEQKGIKKFVRDIIDAHTINGEIDTIKLKNSLPTVQWVANIFGETSSEIVTQLVDAEVRLHTSDDFLAQLTEKTNDVMRINDLSDREKTLLRFLHTSQETQTQANELPIMRYKQEIQDNIASNDFTIIIGGTGCGKTIKVPQMILEMMQPGDKLAVTEPTQINTSELAGRIAQEMGATLGEQIGFQHGGDRKHSEKTDALILTERTLLNQLLEDPLLKEYSFVMVDEVHVRSKDTEQLLEYLKQAQTLRKQQGLNPLKIIIASATVDGKELQEYCNNTKPIEVEGQPQEITEHFATALIPSEQLPQAAADKIIELLKSKNQGDIMCFLKGVKDIEKVEKLLENLSLDGVTSRTIRFHRGSTDEEKQEAGKVAQNGERRIFLATRFGQTGLTINGLEDVIITGEEFENNVDPVTGLENVVVVKQSKAEMKQGRGRVGRTKPGDCHYLFPQSEYDNRPDYPTPEMKRTDLTDVVLLLKRRGIHDAGQFPVLSSPLDPKKIAYAHEKLAILGAYNPDQTLSHIGKRMAELPVDYHLARMVAEAERRKVGIKEACTIAAMAENSQSIFSRDREKAAQAMQTFKAEGSDFLTFANIWNEFTENKSNREWAETNGLDYRGLMKVGETRRKLLNAVKNRGQSRQPTRDEIEQCIAAGYADMLMTYNPATNSYVWERGNVANINLRIDRNSALAGTTPEYIVARSISAIKPGQNYAYLSNCQAAKPEWVV